MNHGKPVRPDRGAAAASNHAIERSPHWSTVRAAYLRGNPTCVACGPEMDTGDANEVHHVVPFHLCVLLGRPDLELDERNLITLCEHDDHDHHLLIGHLNHFQSSNPEVRSDASLRYRGWTREQIRVDVEYQRRSKSRPKEWAKMSEEDKSALRQLMDDLFPFVASAAMPRGRRRRSTDGDPTK